MDDHFKRMLRDRPARVTGDQVDKKCVKAAESAVPLEKLGGQDAQDGSFKHLSLRFSLPSSELDEGRGET